VLALLRWRNRVDAALARVIGGFDDRRLASLDGCGRTKEWLQVVGGLSGPAAAGGMRAVSVTRLLPGLAAAFGAGVVSREHVDRIALTAAEVGEEVVEVVEELLVALASGGGPEALREECTGLVDAAGRGERVPADRRGRRCGVTLGRMGEMWRLRGVLDSETGALLQTAIDGLAGLSGEDGERGAAQRRHDALAELARQRSAEPAERVRRRGAVESRVADGGAVVAEGHATVTRRPESRTQQDSRAKQQGSRAKQGSLTKRSSREKRRSRNGQRC